MIYLFIKGLISGIIVMVVTETSKRSPALGALIVSLPIVSILGMIWLWQDTKDVNRLAVHSESTFWYVLPSLPMFLVLPRLLHAGINFYVALLVCCVGTAILYALFSFILSKFGVNL